MKKKKGNEVIKMEIDDNKILLTVVVVFVFVVSLGLLKFGRDNIAAKNENVTEYKQTQETDENGFRKFENKDVNIEHEAFVFNHDERSVNIEKYKYADFENDKVIIYLHGGSYINKMSDKEDPYMAKLLEYGGGATVYMIDYAVLDEYKEGIKTPLDDVVRFYQKLIYEDEIPKENIIFTGNDSGASLALRACGYMKEVLNDTNYPAGLILIAPYNNPKDMTDTLHADIYKLLSADCKCFEHDIKELIHEDLPKTLIICGTKDIMYPQSESLYDDLSALNVPVTKDFYEDADKDFMISKSKNSAAAWNMVSDFTDDVLYSHMTLGDEE